MSKILKIIMTISIVVAITSFVFIFLQSRYKTESKSAVASFNIGYDVLFTTTSGDILMSPTESINTPMFDIDEYLKGLNFGNLLFNTPEKMKINEKFTVSLTLSPDEITKDELPKTGKNELSKTLIDKSMEAILSGPGFDIKNISSNIQATSMISDTVWKWEITALKSGNQYLYLDLNVKVKIDGEKIPRSIKTFERTVSVKISPLGSVKNFFVKNWQFIVSSVIIPLVIWYWSHRRKIRKKAPLKH